MTHEHASCLQLIFLYLYLPADADVVSLRSTLQSCLELSTYLPARPRGTHQALATLPITNVNITVCWPNKHKVSRRTFILRHPWIVGTMSSISPLRPSSAASFHSVIHNRELHANLLGQDATSDEEPLKPFQRWVSTLRRRKRQQTVPLVTSRSEPWCLDDFDHASLQPYSPHTRSDSNTSSVGIIAGVKSATVTLASVSIAPLSRRASKWRRTHNRSSILSTSDPRPSVDTQRSMLDETGKLRSRKRREKLEELIRTEESYVADLKALSNVCTISVICDRFANNPGVLHFARPPPSYLYSTLCSSGCSSDHWQDAVPPR
jgi:hypothetical protein